MESKNLPKDCVKLSENLETSENGCTSLQQNQVQSSNFTHILENSTKTVVLSQPAKKNFKVKNEPEKINFPIDEFNFTKTFELKENVNKPANFLILGKRSVGKTFLVKDLILKMNQIIDNIIIFSHPNNTIDYSPIIKPEDLSKIISPFDNKYIENIIEERFKPNLPNSTKLLIIFDNVLYSKKDFSILEKLLINARHYNIYTIITMQYPLGFPPEIRTCFDLVFVFQENFESNRKRIYEHYFGLIPTYDIFVKILNQICENYTCLVVNYFGMTLKLKDKLFWYKAQNHLIEPNNLISLVELKKIEEPEYGNKKIKRSRKINIKYEKKDSEPIQEENEILITGLEDNKDDIYLSELTDNKLNTVTHNDKKNIIIEKIKKNNKLIKKITKQNEKLYELL